MAEVTGVRTEYTVSVDTAAVYRSQSTVDLASLLALACSLAEEGYATVLWRELLKFRDDRNAIAAAHQELGLDGTVIGLGLDAWLLNKSAEAR
ncbi:MAG TPA: hypothetical protein VGW74_19760 [Propionibacteriaceae bacterium]|nr:hypothetical protein [Propionibacteriaceae bacterium]